MTNEEAVKVCQIISTADGECYVCVGKLLALCMDDFPEIDWPKIARESTEISESALKHAEEERNS